MPKPLFGENGSGIHTHMSLFKGGRNQFFDRRDEHHLSHDREELHRRTARARARDVGRPRAVGQLVQAARARLRSAGIRRVVAARPLGAHPDSAVQAGLGTGDARGDSLPDPACNPYLAFAALLQAGLEGIEKGYELPDPMESNLYRLTASQRREQGIVALPESLGEAIDELAGSELMQLALGERIFPRYVELKRKEWDEYRVQVTEWEKEKYLAAL